jgi:hypothetical protein
MQVQARGHRTAAVSAGVEVVLIVKLLPNPSTPAVVMDLGEDSAAQVPQPQLNPVALAGNSL